MNLLSLMEIQKIIEDRIILSSGMSEDMIGEENILDSRFLAFQVKLGTLANLTKCYKYLPGEVSTDKSKMMLAYIDAMQQLLSIGNKYQYNIATEEFLGFKVPHSPLPLFSQAMTLSENLKRGIREDNYIDSIGTFLNLIKVMFSIAASIGLEYEEIMDYYKRIA